MPPAVQAPQGQATDRRTVHYASFDELLADAERLAGQPVRVLGNWSQGQIYRHLAVTSDAMIDGFPVGLPRPVQWLLRLAMKRRMLTRPMPSGFQIPRRGAALVPEPDAPVPEALDQLRTAVARLQSTVERAPHPGFGHLTRDEWDQFQLRHGELHMSFIRPISSPDSPVESRGGTV